MTPNRELLLDLCDALTDLHETGNWRAAGFNMGNWAKYKLPETPLLGCGTSCCAYGLGTTLDSWRAAGLTLVPGTNKIWFPKGGPFMEDGDEELVILGLNLEQWNYIFMPTKYDAPLDEISPQDVVTHILMVLG